jgi:FkbM family methyltransferase
MKDTPRRESHERPRKAAPFLICLAGACSRTLPYYRGKWKLSDRMVRPRLAKTGWTEVVKLRCGLRIAGDLFDEVGENIWWLGEQYERGNVTLLRSLLKPGDVFLDAGANIGLFTLLAAHLVGPEGFVVGVEPVAELFHSLQRSVVELNHLGNVICVHAALSSKAGQGVIHIGAGDNLGSSSLEKHGGQDGESQPVDLVTVDALAAQHPRLRRVAVMKIDTEGHELKVLEGARQTMASAKPSILIEVRNELLRSAGGSSEAVFQYFGELGYNSFRILSSGKLEPLDAPEEGTLILFAHPDRAGAVSSIQPR